MNEKQKICLDDCHTIDECILCDETHKKDIENCPCGNSCEGSKIFTLKQTNDVKFYSWVPL